MIINASPLIIFGRLNKLEILKKLYANLKITPEVHKEVVVKGMDKNLRDALVIKGYIDNNIINIIDLNKASLALTNKIRAIYNIDNGEAETIALALQLKEKEIVIDEIAAREAARALGITPIGSLRVLLLAYKNKLISKEDIKGLVDEMEDSKYRFSPKVLIEFWEMLEKVE